MTISDFVADLRAATPSNGAELCVPDMAELNETIAQYGIRINRALTSELKMMRKRLDDLSLRRVMQDPETYIDDKRLLLDRTRERMLSALDRELARRKNTYISYVSKLDALSPLKVLARGYSIAEKEDGKLLHSKNDVAAGDKIIIRLSDGKVHCTADGEE